MNKKTFSGVLILLVLLTMSNFSAVIAVSIDASPRKADLNQQPTSGIGVLVGDVDYNLQLALNQFEITARHKYTVVNDLSTIDNYRYVFIFAHGNTQGIKLAHGILTWEMLGSFFDYSSETQLIHLVACDGIYLKNFAPRNIAVAGVDGQLDAIAGGLSAALVYATIGGNRDMMDKMTNAMYKRLNEIDKGDSTFPLSFWYYSSDYVIKRKCVWKACVTYERTAWAAVYGGGVGTSLTAVSAALLTVSLLLAEHSATGFTFLKTLVTAVRTDLAAVIAQVATGILTRSDHRAALGLHAGSFPNLHFYPYVDYGSYNIILVLPSLYGAIASAGIAGLVGVVLTEAIIGPIAFNAFKNINTDGRLVPV